MLTERRLLRYLCEEMCLVFALGPILEMDPSIKLFYQYRVKIYCGNRREYYSVYLTVLDVMMYL